MHRKLDLVLKSQANRKDVSFVGRTDRNGEYDEEDFDDNEEMNYIENNQGFQNRGYPNQTYNNQPYRSNFGGQGGGMRPQRFNGLNQKYQGTLNCGNNSNPTQSQQANADERDILVRIGNLIRKATSENTQASEETNNMLVNMTNRIESRINAWECRIYGLEKRLTTAEEQMTGLTEEASHIRERNQALLERDYCQLLDEKKRKKRDSKKHVYHIRIVCEDEEKSNKSKITLTTNTPPLPFPDTFRIAKQQKEDYEEAVSTLKTIETSTKFAEVMLIDQGLKEHHEQLTARKRWFETRTGYYGLEKPYPTLTYPLHYFDKRLALDGSSSVMQEEKGEALELGCSEPLDINRSVRKSNPKRFLTTCFINDKESDNCILDLGASKNIMPMHLSARYLTDAMRKTTGPINIAFDVPVVLQGNVITTDFLVTDTGNQNSKVVLGRPFLSVVGAKTRCKKKGEAIRKVRLKPPWRDGQSRCASREFLTK